MYIRYLLALLLLITCMGVGYTLSDRLARPENSATVVPEETSFHIMMQVLTYNRCVNSHPAGDRPRQGEDSQYHYSGVVREPDNHGVPGLQCSPCHQAENNDYSGVPGAPDWGLGIRNRQRRKPTGASSGHQRRLHCSRQGLGRRRRANSCRVDYSKAHSSTL